MSVEFSICSLVSGSSGNSFYVECSEGALLIDAGVSAKKIAENVTAVGGNMDQVDGLVITHGHGDHIQGAGVVSRRYGIPLFMTEGAYATSKQKLGKLAGCRLFRPGGVITAAGLRIHTYPTPHDAADSVALVVERNGARCGVLTDLGHPFPGLEEIIGSLDAVFLESNYDPEMLAHGPYHESLKERIRSPHGHISNSEATSLICAPGNQRLKVAVLSHLSETNNHPRIAQCTLKEKLAQCQLDKKIQVCIAPRHTPSEVVKVARHK